MQLTEKTFTGMIRLFRATYGPTWRSDLDTDRYAQVHFFMVCQMVIPEEMVDELISVFCMTRAKAPESPFDIVLAYIDMRIESALSSDDAIDRIVNAIRDYNSDVLFYSSCDDYLLTNVLWVFPCSEGVKKFYLKNKSTLEYLATQYPSVEEKKTIYKDLGFEYRRILYNTERQMIITKTQGLLSGKQSTELLEGN